MSLYIPDLATDDFGPFIQGVADNFALLEDSRIVECGVNENGEYWRWANGLVICRAINRVAERVTPDVLQWVVKLPYAGLGFVNVSVATRSPIGDNNTSYTTREFSELQWFITRTSSFLYFIHPSGWALGDFVVFDIIALGRLS